MKELYTQHTLDLHFSTASNESLSTVENTIAQACAPSIKNTRKKNTSSNMCTMLLTITCT